MPPVVAPPIWKKEHIHFPAIPICRSCVESHKLYRSTLVPQVEQYMCQVEKCEHTASYLVV